MFKLAESSIRLTAQIFNSEIQHTAVYELQYIN